MSDLAEQARQASLRVERVNQDREDAIRVRDEVIMAMREDGDTLFTIAKVANLSLEGVRKVLHRRGMK